MPAAKKGSGPAEPLHQGEHVPGRGELVLYPSGPEELESRSRALTTAIDPDRRCRTLITTRRVSTGGFSPPHTLPLLVDRR
jgi:hypothetical protein